MPSNRKLVRAGLALCLLACTMPLAADVPEKTEPVKAEPVKIGMVNTLFTDIPPALIQFVAGPFGGMMKDFTGLDGKMVVSGDPLETAKKLNDRTIDLAVLHGVEFGWAQQKFPDLRPLMVATNINKSVRAHVVVRADSGAKAFIDLKGKSVSLPRRSKEHCRLFLAKHCAEFGQCSPKAFFQQLVASANIELALDDCCLGKVHGVITDTLALEAYESIKPGCFAGLKILTSSEVFPPAAIAYRRGHLDDATLNKFRDGMINANKDEKGREVMAMFKMNAFDPVPDNYALMLADIIRAYPAPEAFDISRK